MSNGKIAVDLDGTLAKYDGWKGPQHIGELVLPMYHRILNWLADGYEVVIFTARIHKNKEAEDYLRKWLDEIGLFDVGITNIKTPEIIELWDDRAIGVEFNTGNQMNDISQR